MDRKYKTSNQGIAAYLVMKGHEILRLERGTNKAGRDTTFIEFDLDITEGRQLGDEFFDGSAHGNLKQFYDAQYTVRSKIYGARG